MTYLRQRSGVGAVVFMLVLLMPVFLTAGNNAPVFSQASLDNIVFPVGGLGAGSIDVNGHGAIQSLDIFNQSERRVPLGTGFSIWMKPTHDQPVVKLLEGKKSADSKNNGMTGFESCEFKGTFPIAEISLEDSQSPVHVMLETYNPLVPFDVKASGFPVAVFNWHVENKSQKPITCALAFHMVNPIQVHENGSLVYRKNVNSISKLPDFQGILMKGDAGLGDADYAEMALGTHGQEVVLQTRCPQDDIGQFWDVYSKKGQIEQIEDSGPSEDGTSPMAAVVTQFTLSAGEKRVIPFYLMWYVPNRMIGEPGKPGSLKKEKNRYAKKFDKFADVIANYLKAEEENTEITRQFRDVLYRSAVPTPVLDALSASLVTLKSTDLMLTGKGKIYCIQDLNGQKRCAVNTIPAWNYAQTLAWLYPSLEKEMREISFYDDTDKNGFQKSQSLFPQNDELQIPLSTDGQFGNVLAVYRDWRLSGSRKWMKDIWPQVKRTMDFSWKGVDKTDEKSAWQNVFCPVPWDANRDGMIEGMQSVSYGHALYGPNTLVGSLYLAALRAASQMAMGVGDLVKANEYMAMYKLGRQRYEQFCWNGKYYGQHIEIAQGLNPELNPDSTGHSIPDYQYNQGCLSDQLAGQYLAHIAGLGGVLDEMRMDRAMYAVYKHNFVKADKNPGLLNCTWPYGNRPDTAIGSADDMCPGVEYAAAAMMIYSGLVQEGIEVVEASRHRQNMKDGNPWGKGTSVDENIKAMSSWGLLLALSGFEYDAKEKIIGFRPRISHYDFQAFWSCGEAWGEFKVDKHQLLLTVVDGDIEVEQLNLTGPQGVNQVIKAEKNDDSIELDVTGSDGAYKLLFKGDLKLKSGDGLHIVFE